jgi:hypothetical protein
MSCRSTPIECVPSAGHNCPAGQVLGNRYKHETCSVHHAAQPSGVARRCRGCRCGPVCQYHQHLHPVVYGKSISRCEQLVDLPDRELLQVPSGFLFHGIDIRQGNSDILAIARRAATLLPCLIGDPADPAWTHKKLAKGQWRCLSMYAVICSWR